jgi:hypothetical protein
MPRSPISSRRNSSSQSNSRHVPVRAIPVPVRAIPAPQTQSLTSIAGQSVVSGFGTGVGFSLANKLVGGIFGSSAPSPSPSPVVDNEKPQQKEVNCYRIVSAFHKCKETNDSDYCKDLLESANREAFDTCYPNMR